MKQRFMTAKIVFILLFFSLLTIISCKKEQSGSGTDEQQQVAASMASSEADGEAEGVFNNLFDDVLGANDDVGLSGTGIFFGRMDSLTPVTRCFTVTIKRPNNTPFPVVITVDFGTTGCKGPDGHVRRGKVITEYSARLIKPEAHATTTFDGYYVDSVKVEGTHRITNVSDPSAALPARKFKVEVIEGKLTKPNGNYIKWNSTKNISQIEGLLTLNPLDDIYRIEGSSRGQVLHGNLLVGWESGITEPLIKRFTCQWIVKGRIKTVRLNTSATGRWVAELDFGNGDCDNKATITINGMSYQINLR